MVKQREQANESKKNSSRREFIGASAAIAGGIMIVPRHVLGRGQTPPSEKLNIAGIGVGGKGYSDLTSVRSEHIAALCDVDLGKMQRASKEFPDAKKYQDYREMLETHEDLDAVIVATPDHMHAPISMAAMAKGKHVYCQKPLTHSVAEAREMSKMARKMKVATQMGNQGLAGENVRITAEWLADGCIGDVEEVHIWTDRPIWPQGVARPKDTPSVPGGLDWNGWIGVAPMRPYHPAYHPFSWRGWWDFGTGALGDIGCHSMAPVFRQLNLGSPTEVESCCSTYDSRSLGDYIYKGESFPRASIVRYRFPARKGRGPITMHWYDGGLRPERPAELEDGRDLGTNGTMFVGSKGKMLNGRIIPEVTMKAYTRPEKTLPRSIGHYEEWVAAAKGGEAGGSNFSFAGLVTETVLLGNVALRTGKRLKWDARKMEITNVPEANQFLQSKYREDWKL